MRRGVSVKALEKSTQRFHSQMRLLALFFGLFVLAVVVAADLGWLAPISNVLHSYPGADKVGHFVLIGGLAFLIAASVVQRGGGRTRAAKALGVFSLVVVLEELSQLFLATRHFDILDLVFDLLGILILGGAGVVFFARREPCQ